METAKEYLEKRLKLVEIAFNAPWAATAYEAVTLATTSLLTGNDHVIVINMPEAIGGGYIVWNLFLDEDTPQIYRDFYDTVISLSDGVNWNLTNESVGIVEEGIKPITKPDKNIDTDELIAFKDKKREAFLKAVYLPFYFPGDKELEKLLEDDNMVAVQTDEIFAEAIFVGTEEEVKPFEELGYVRV